MKSNNINRILNNKSKIKLCVGIIVGITILTGCKINSNHNNSVTESVSVESKQEKLLLEISSNEKYIINIDYDEKTLNIEIEE